MKFKLLLVLLCSLLWHHTNAQQPVVLYFNEAWEVSQKESAAYYRECQYDLNDFTLNGPVKDFTISGSLIMEGQYADGEKYGLFKFFYPNGQPKSIGSYLNTKREEEWKYYYPNGQLKFVASFPAPPDESDFSILEFYDASGEQKIKNGTGTWTIDSVRLGIFDPQSPKTLTGKFKNGKKHGKWKLIRMSDGKLWHTESFYRGTFMGAEMYDAHLDHYGAMQNEVLNKFPDEHEVKFKNTESFKLDGSSFNPDLLYQDVETIFKTVTGKEHKIQNREAGYPYGDYSLLEFIDNNIIHPESASEKNISGTVYVHVAIDAKGKATSISIFKELHPDLDKEAIRVIQKIETWLPEIIEGEAVPSSVTIPVRF